MTVTVPATKGIHQTWEFEASVPCGLVVGVDGSTESVAALNTAASIARFSRCALHVVSVIPPFPPYHIDSGDSRRESNVEELRVQLREAAIRDLLKAADADSAWTSQVVTGRPARELTRIAEERAAELIVVGRRTHGMMDRMMEGETTLQVMRLSSIPVMAVPSDLDGPRSVVVAVDFSAPSLRAAKIAAELLRKTGTLYLVHVEPPVDIFSEGFALAGESRHPGDMVVWFRRLTESLGEIGDVMVEPVVLNGRAVPAILEFAERVGANMIAAGSHGHSRMERFLLGSVSTGLVRNAACPVLITPGHA